MEKISIIGAGHVGATLAYRVATEGLADVLLIDLDEKMACGKALDITDAASALSSDCRAESGGYEDLKGSKAVVVTAGFARKPGMSRDDLLHKNAEVVKSVTVKIKECAPDTIIVMITNPLDVMSCLAYRVSGFSKNRVMGMAGVLDTARLKSILSARTGKESSLIEAMVLGTHGDTMVPIKSTIKIEGRPASDFLNDEELAEVFKATKERGAEIVDRLQGSSAYYAPAASAYTMLTAILKDKKTLLPASVYLEGEYGLDGVCMGVPVEISAAGAGRIKEIEITPQEKEALHKAAGMIKANINKISGA